VSLRKRAPLLALIVCSTCTCIAVRAAVGQSPYSPNPGNALSSPAQFPAEPQVGIEQTPSVSNESQAASNPLAA